MKIQFIALFLLSFVAIVSSTASADEGSCLVRSQQGAYFQARCEANPANIEFLLVQAEANPLYSKVLIAGLAANKNLLPVQEIRVLELIASLPKGKARVISAASLGQAMALR